MLLGCDHRGLLPAVVPFEDRKSGECPPGGTHTGAAFDDLKWYTLRERDIAFGLGVYGQNVFVDKAGELVVAKVSSQPPPLDKNLIDLTITFVEAMSDRLA